MAVRQDVHAQTLTRSTHVCVFLCVCAMCVCRRVQGKMSVPQRRAVAHVVALASLVQPAAQGTPATLGAGAQPRVVEVLRHDAAKDDDELFALSLKVRVACVPPAPAEPTPATPSRAGWGSAPPHMPRP